MVTIELMEVLLLIEAEAKALLTGKNHSYERSLKEELLTILEEAELWFGPRDRSYEMLEPRITERYYASPLIYPSKKIRIYLTKEAKLAPYYSTYELAHEAIHVLSPVWTLGATVLEEGLATYFCFKYVKLIHGIHYETTGDPHYDAAFRAVSRLIANAQNEFLIKELREHQPVISRIDEKLLVEVAGCEPDLAKFLCRDFRTYRDPPVSWSGLASQAQLFARGAQAIWDEWSSQSKA